MPRLLRALCAASAAVVVLPEIVLAQTTILPPVTVQGGRQVQPARRPAPAPAPTDAAVEATVDPNLPPVENTTAGPVQGYRALTAVSATKTNTPLEQIPQNIGVVPRSVINDQVSTSVSEALLNVSNVQPVNPLVMGNTDFYPIKIRGFGAEMWRDGLNVPYLAGDRDGLVNVERIEVLKGPNAILYGGGVGAPIGGAVNIVSKLPTDKAHSEFGIIFGSEKYWNPYFDINQPLNADKTVLFRFTGEYTGNKSFVNVLDSQRYNLNPTLTLTNKTDTTFIIQGFVSRQQQQAYQGLPVYGTLFGDLKLNRDMFIGPSDIPQSYSKSKGVTFTFDHQFDAVWSANVKARWSQSEFDQFSQSIFGSDCCGGFPLAPFPPFWGPNNWIPQNIELFQQQKEFTINPNLQAKFTLGPTRNTFLIGADYTNVKDQGFMTGDTLGATCALTDPFCPVALPLINLGHPDYKYPYTKPSPSAGDEFLQYFNFNNTYLTKGVYAQLQSTFYDRIHVLVGGRYANLDITYDEMAPLASPGVYVTDQTKFLPRAGVVVDLFKGLSAFASYSEGMKWAGFVPVAQPKPEFSKQAEGGLKFNINDQLSGTLAAFEINRENVPLVTGPGQATLTGQQSRGYEADVLYQPNRNWSFLGSYAYTDATFSDPSRFNGMTVPVGNQLPGVPTYSGRLWANYKFDSSFLPGWSVGAGIYKASSQFVDPTNLWITQGYYTIDAKIAYEDQRYKLAITAKNLTGEEYFTPYTWFGGQVAPSAPRAVYGQLAVKFN